MADRSFSFVADGRPFSFSGRVRLEGKDDLSLYPSLFLLELWNLPEESFLLLSRTKKLSVSHAGACLVSGQVSDVFRREIPDGTLTSVAVSSGLELWETPVSLTVPAGTSVSESVRSIFLESGIGISLLNDPAPDDFSLRPAVFFGRAAECVTAALSAAKCRPVLTPSGILAVPEGGLPASYRLTEEDLQEEPSFVGGSAHGALTRMVLVTRLAGWRPGQSIEVNCGNIHATGIISERGIDADTASGAWKSELIVVLVN